MFEKNVHHSDLSKLENQRGLNTPFETGQLSSAVVDQPITKSREQIVTNEKSGPLKHFGWDFTSRQTRIAVHLCELARGFDVTMSTSMHPAYAVTHEPMTSNKITR